MCDLRKQAHLQKNYTPKGETDSILPGTYYLSHVDDMYRRTYEIKQ
jgi:hydroxymethylglutaryl-CoA synthase